MLLFAKTEICTISYWQEWQGNIQSWKSTNADLHLLLVSSGTCTITLQEQEMCRIQAGECMLLKQSFELHASEPAHCLGVGLQGSAVQDAMKQTQMKIHCNAANCPQFVQELAVCSHMMQGSFEQDEKVLMAFRLLLSVSYLDEAQESTALSEIVTKAVFIMREYFSTLYGIDDLCEQLNVSKSHFVRVFHQEMGISPGQYLTQVRLSAAKVLLSHRKDSLEMVANLCGFSNSNYFCKVFKKHIQMTPHAWRTQNHTAEYNESLLKQIEQKMYT